MFFFIFVLSPPYITFFLFLILDASFFPSWLHLSYYSTFYFLLIIVIPLFFLFNSKFFLLLHDISFSLNTRRSHSGSRFPRLAHGLVCVHPSSMTLPVRPHVTPGRYVTRWDLCWPLEFLPTHYYWYQDTLVVNILMKDIYFPRVLKMLKSYLFSFLVYTISVFFFLLTMCSLWLKVMTMSKYSWVSVHTCTNENQSETL